MAFMAFIAFIAFMAFMAFKPCTWPQDHTPSSAWAIHPLRIRICTLAACTPPRLTPSGFNRFHTPAKKPSVDSEFIQAHIQLVAPPRPETGIPCNIGLASSTPRKSQSPRLNFNRSGSCRRCTWRRRRLVFGVLGPMHEQRPVSYAEIAVPCSAKTSVQTAIP